MPKHFVGGSLKQTSTIKSIESRADLQGLKKEHRESSSNKERPGRDTQSHYGHPPQPLPSGTPDLSCYLETPCTRSCGEGFRLLLPNPDITAGCYGAAMQVNFGEFNVRCMRFLAIRFLVPGIYVI